VVCAQIEHNPTNNAYVAAAVRRYPGRLIQVVDLDSSWSKRYHTPGSANRLRSMARRWPVRGFTHYLHPSDDGAWLNSEDGRALFAAAGELGLLASLSCYPHQLPAIRQAAQRAPQVPVLLHHLGHPTRGRGSLQENLAEILRCAPVSNIYIKLSGYAYASENAWDFPYHAAQEIVRAEYEHFGARRMCWGSDYPVVRFSMTYQQSLEVFRSHADFIPPEEKDWILGKSIAAIFDTIGETGHST
jgi:L-fuconolactonase